MGVADFQYIIVGGSTKCGTTSVFTYLNDHPSVCGSKIKESRFFWNNAYELKSPQFSYKDGIEKFDLLFNCNKQVTHRLEATPDYLYDSTCAKIIHQNLPNVLMVFILRNPLSRLESWYKFATQLNYLEPNCTINDYIEMQFNNTNPAAPQYLLALEQGLYAKYLKPYIDIFGVENILILNYQDLAENPGHLMNQICKRANLNASFYDNYDFKILNKSINVKSPEKFNRYRNFRRGLRKLIKSMPDFIGKPFKAVIQPIDKAYINMTSHEWEKINMDKKLIQRLEEYYQSDQILVKSMMNQ